MVHYTDRNVNTNKIPTCLQDKPLVDNLLSTSGLKIRRLQESQEEFIDNLQKKKNMIAVHQSTNHLTIKSESSVSKLVNIIP